MVSRGTAAIRACRHHKLQFRRLMSNLSEYRVSREEEIWARCDFSTAVRGVFLPFAAADWFLCRAAAPRAGVCGAQSCNQRLPRFPEIVGRDRQHAFRPISVVFCRHSATTDTPPCTFGNHWNEHLFIDNRGNPALPDDLRVFGCTDPQKKSRLAGSTRWAGFFRLHGFEIGPLIVVRSLGGTERFCEGD